MEQNVRYRIPYRVNRAGAKTKARIAYEVVVADKGTIILPTEDASFVEFEARSHAEARRKLEHAILPYDRRPVWGRSNVHLFVEE